MLCARQIHGNTVMERGGVLFPVIIVKDVDSELVLRLGING